MDALRVVINFQYNLRNQRQILIGLGILWLIVIICILVVKKIEQDRDTVKALTIYALSVAGITTLLLIWYGWH